MAVSATTNPPKVLISENGARGDRGIDGIDGLGFNQVRKQKLDNPLLHLFKTNDTETVSASPLIYSCASTSTYIDRYGNVKTAAINEIKDKAKDGVLLEQSSTNLLLHSNDVSQSVWIDSLSGTALATITTSSFATAPDGTNTASRLQMDLNGGTTAGDLSDRRQNAVSVVGKHTFSIWLKSNTGSDQNVMIVNATQEQIVVTSEWQRFEVVYDYTSGSVSGRVRLRGGVTDDTCDLLVWGGQMEVLPFSTSTIITGASTVTRSQTDCSIANLNNAPLTSESFSICGRVTGIGAFTGDVRYIFEYALASTGTLRLYANSTLDNIIFRFDDQSSSLTCRLTPLNINDFFFVCIYDSSANEISIFIDGVKSAPTSTSAVNLPLVDLTGVVGIFSNQLLSNSNRANGHIRDFRVYDFALNDYEAQFLAGA